MDALCYREAPIAPVVRTINGDVDIFKSYIKMEIN